MLTIDNIYQYSIHIMDGIQVLRQLAAIIKKDMKTDILSTAVRLGLLILSIIGWITLTVGGWIQYNIVLQKTDKDILKYQLYFLAPFFLLWLGAIPSYILTVLHLIMNLRCKNGVNIMHCLLIGYTTFVGALGSLSILGTILYFQLPVGLINCSLRNIEPKYLKEMLIGVSMTLFFQWISSSIWPLFNFERRPQRQQYREMEESTNIPVHTNYHQKNDNN